MMRSYSIQQQHLTMDENVVPQVQNILMMRLCMVHSANGAGFAAELRLQCIYSSMQDCALAQPKDIGRLPVDVQVVDAKSA